MHLSAATLILGEPTPQEHSWVIVHMSGLRDGTVKFSNKRMGRYFRFKIGPRGGITGESANTQRAFKTGRVRRHRPIG